MRTRFADGTVGCLFEAQEYYVPEMLVSARAMQSGLKPLKPLLTSQDPVSGTGATPRAVFGTVKGDLHDIGKDLVVMMLEGAGFKVVESPIVFPDRVRGKSKMSPAIMREAMVNVLRLRLGK